MNIESKRITAPNRTIQSTLSRIIEEANQAESRRDVEQLERVLSPVWSDLDGPPSIPETDEATNAELLRLCGFFLGYYGHLKNKPDFQERGKDLLSSAIDIFENAGLTEGAARARLNLAWRYQQQGSFEEARVILEYTKANLDADPDHPIHLGIRVFECVASIARGETDVALDRITRIEKAVEKFDNNSLRTQFHIEAGLVYTRTGDLKKAVRHHRKALESSKAMGNSRFVAIAKGNLAYVLKDQRDYPNAHKQIEKAIAINMDAGNKGFLAHNYDTKAQILFDECEYGRSLAAIENALGLFSEGEDFAGLADAKLNKARILFKLGEVEQSLIIFSEVVSLAREKISETAARQYASQYQKLFYVPTGGDYKIEVARFRKHILKEALVNAGLVMKDAAASLNISQAMLSDIIRRQFPELFDELGIKKRRTRRGRSRSPVQ